MLRRLRALNGLLLISSTATAQQHRPTSALVAHLVDSLAAKVVADGLAPGLGVAVAMDGHTILSKGYGMADVTAGIPATDRTLWYLASTSKSLTGFGIALLADRGVIRFQDPIMKLLPGVQWNSGVHSDSLTLASFLSHTHHVNDQSVVTAAAFTGAIPESRWPELIRLAERMPTNDLVYSNFGYNVAAMVIDAKRPEGWRSFLEKNVNRPAGMRETHTQVSGLDSRKIARPGALLTTGRYQTAPFFKTDRTMNSAGGHLSTLHDLARWTIVQMDSGVVDGRRVFPKSAVVLSQTLIAKQTREQAKKFAYFDREGWGSGWEIGSYEGERMISRFGGYGDIRSHLSFLPARRIGVVAISTGGNPVATDLIAAFAYDLEAGRSDARERAAARLDTLQMQLAGQLKSIARTDSVRAARQLQPLAHLLAQFVGSYVEPDYGTISFDLTKGKLRYRWGDVYGPVEIFDASKNQMRIEVVGSGNVVTFNFPETGPAASVSLQGALFKRTR